MTERSDAHGSAVVVPRQDTSLAGKVAFITGATRGIGRATALAFAREGANVVVTDVAADGNGETARKIEQAGGQALAVSCDATRADDITAGLDAGVERFGRQIPRRQAPTDARTPAFVATRHAAPWPANVAVSRRPDLSQRYWD